MHLRSLGPKPSVLAATLRAEKPRLILEKSRGLDLGETNIQPPCSLEFVARFGAPGRTCTGTLPADNGLLFYSATGAKWWEVLVMLQSSLPTVICDTGFTDRQPEHLPKLVAGVGVAPTEAELMRLA